jgi:tetraacyldisaccharide-1-P 4'-kinase
VPVAVAHLDITGFEGMRSALPIPRGARAGRRVVAAAGVADPGSFAGQLETLGARVHLLAFPDHHTYAAGDVKRLVDATGGAGSVRWWPCWP